MDIFPPDKRSEIMSSIRGKNTQAEIIVFRYLRNAKIHFQAHYPRAVGKPDIALPRKKRAVFIDGDFWHGRQFYQQKDKLPSDFWRKKIQSNLDRDVTVNNSLKTSGWAVLRVWESELKRKRTRDIELERIQIFLLTGEQ